MELIKRWPAVVMMAIMSCVAAEWSATHAGEVRMQSGHLIRFLGKPVPVTGLTLDTVAPSTPDMGPSYPITMFDAVSRRYFMSQSVVEEVQLGDSYQEEFLLPIRPLARLTMFGSVGNFVNVEPFSEFGRRIVSLQGPDKIIDVVQAISKVQPDYVELTGVNYNWQYSVATSTLPPKVIRQAISRSIDEHSQQDRQAVVRFYIDSRQFQEAQQELERIGTDFPDLQAKVRELRLEIRQLQAVQFLNEFQRRLAAGQYQLVYNMARQFPREDINQATLQQVDRMIQEHQTALEQIDRIQAQLSRLQAEVKDSALLPRFRDMRSVVSSRLSRSNLERLAPFTQNLEDDFLSADQKLALAYSGWVVGPALAETDPQTTLHYWDARDRVLEYLRSHNPVQKSEILTQLRALENIGPDIVAAIVQQLGPVYEASQTDQPLSLETRDDAQPVPYHVILPAEYAPDRKYPVVLALHAGGISPAQTAYWWGGDAVSGPAHRYGYIVIAPEYQLTPDQNDPITSQTIHQRVISVLRDARRRFAVDSDRVFLAGHGQGGDAACDLGMSRPDLFAGLIMITGRTNEYARNYWENCKQLPLYVVSGELDGDSFRHNADDLNRMMRHRYDVLLTEYKQRGHEDYREELPHILEWMLLHQRAPLPPEFEMKTMRPSDNRFHWLEVTGLPQSILKPRLSRTGEPIPPRPLPIKVTLTAGNTLYVSAGADRIALWLTPDVVSFEDRLKVQWKGRTVFNEIPERNIETMLEHLSLTGDRERLYWQHLSF